jgi:hypothetical protein
MVLNFELLGTQERLEVQFTQFILVDKRFEALLKPGEDLRSNAKDADRDTNSSSTSILTT